MANWTVSYLKDDYAIPRGLDGWYRDLLVCEAKKIGWRTSLYVAEGNRVRECKLNGAPKTWKTFPGVELSLKIGYRGHARVGGRELQYNEAVCPLNRTRIVVPVSGTYPADMPPLEVYMAEYDTLEKIWLQALAAD